MSTHEIRYISKAFPHQDVSKEVTETPYPSGCVRLPRQCGSCRVPPRRHRHLRIRYQGPQDTGGAAPLRRHGPPGITTLQCFSVSHQF